jgi:exonuclease III
MPQLKIISYNLNGIRSAVSKGLADWIKETQYDVYLFQEIKANELDVPKKYLMIWDMCIILGSPPKRKAIVEQA